MLRYCFHHDSFPPHLLISVAGSGSKRTLKSQYSVYEFRITLGGGLYFGRGPINRTVTSSFEKCRFQKRSFEMHIFTTIHLSADLGTTCNQCGSPVCTVSSYCNQCGSPVCSVSSYSNCRFIVERKIHQEALQLSSALVRLAFSK